MSTSVTMPALGESVSEGTVTRWLKQEGDQVNADEPLLEVSTDKVDTEIPSPASGVLTKILVGEDETVAVGPSWPSSAARTRAAAQTAASRTSSGPSSSRSSRPSRSSSPEQQPAAEQEQPEQPAGAGREGGAARRSSGGRPAGGGGGGGGAW